MDQVYKVFLLPLIRYDFKERISCTWDDSYSKQLQVTLGAGCITGILSAATEETYMRAHKAVLFSQC